jgi:hypothetical protein
MRAQQANVATYMHDVSPCQAPTRVEKADLTFTLRRLQALQPCLDFRWGRRMGIVRTPTTVRAAHRPNDRHVKSLVKSFASCSFRLGEKNRHPPGARFPTAYCIYRNSAST